MTENYLSSPLPMVNETNMKQFANRYAIVHGKVSSIKNNNLYLCINPENNTEIIVKNFTQNVRVGSMIKIIGNVYIDLSLEFVSYYQLADDFDLKLVNEVIPILHHKDVSAMFL